MRGSKIKILITRREAEAAEFKSALASVEADIVYFPALKMKELENDAVREMFENVESFDFIVFTSANAVKYFLKLKEKYSAKINLRKISVACTGKKTAEYCLSQNIRVDVLPNNYSAAGLLEFFEANKINGKRFLIPCSSLAREELPEGLKRLGAFVEKTPIYEVGLPEAPEIKGAIECVVEKKPDIFAFTSPSSFMNFLKLLNIENSKKYFLASTIAAIGSTTQKAIEKQGLKVDIVPLQFTLEQLGKTIVEYLNQKVEVK